MCLAYPFLLLDSGVNTDATPYAICGACNLLLSDAAEAGKAQTACRRYLKEG